MQTDRVVLSLRSEFCRICQKHSESWSRLRGRSTLNCSARSRWRATTGGSGSCWRSSWASFLCVSIRGEPVPGLRTRALRSSWASFLFASVRGEPVPRWQKYALCSSRASFSCVSVRGEPVPAGTKFQGLSIHRMWPSRYDIARFLHTQALAQ